MAQMAEQLAKLADDTAAAGGGSGGYVYLSLVDAKKMLNMKVNLFAKISEVGLPRRSKGTDYCLILKVIDISCSTQAFSVNFFSGRKENLPKVKSAGDIICLHQVEMKIHKGDVYFLFNKRFSSFALFDGKIGPNPYQISENYRMDDHSNALLPQLRELSLEPSSDAGMSTSLSLLRDIESGKVFDIVCKVLHVRETSTGDWMLLIWDGTDCPPICFQTDLDAEKENPAPLHPEPLISSRETLCLFPCVGTVMRVISGKIFEGIKSLQDYDRWVKLYNVSVELHSEIWTGVMNNLSRIFILSDEDGNVKSRRRAHSERLTSDIGRLPFAGSLKVSNVTETEFEKVPYVTLMDSITNSQVVQRCKCVVRIVASCPWRGEDLRSADGLYRVRLTLEDPTARVHAYIVGEEAVNFFGGVLGPDELTKKMMKLLGVTELESSNDGCSPVSRNPPWIECCLMSCYLDENDHWGSRRYMIYATRLT